MNIKKAWKRLTGDEYLTWEDYSDRNELLSVIAWAQKARETFLPRV